jgi:hypothetical protein
MNDQHIPSPFDVLDEDAEPRHTVIEASNKKVDTTPVESTIKPKISLIAVLSMVAGLCALVLSLYGMIVYTAVSFLLLSGASALAIALGAISIISMRRHHTSRGIVFSIFGILFGVMGVIIVMI